MHDIFFVFVPACQSILIIVVGYTFDDNQAPAEFVPHWDDWLGETAEVVEDWRNGPFYQHFPPQKGSFCALFIRCVSLHVVH